MGLKPYDRKISQIFNNIKYDIDFYQREYKWNDALDYKPVSSLLKDIFYRFDLEKYNPNLEITPESIGKLEWYYLNSFMTIHDDSFCSIENLFFKWKQITGRGQYVSNVREFFWPALHCKESARLKHRTLKLNNWWSNEINKQEWLKDDYYKGIMIHLDETLKLFIRTCSIFCCEEDRISTLFSLLPNNESKAERANIQYEWGVWFQALRGIVENCDLNYLALEHFESAFTNVKSILTKNKRTYNPNIG